jgi:serine/threonine protein kinase
MTVAEEPALVREGAELAPGLRVVEHLARNVALDVYDAWDDERHCRVIAKTVRPDRADSERVVRRLLHEGELLARLAHPHIVRAFETRTRPRAVVVLETLSGETLDHLIHERARRLSCAEVAILGAQLASAVRYLHRAGHLHLDLKPDNVIVDQGFAKVLDLSLTRPPGPGQRGLGTPLYMAPEQARGDAFTAATDVWGVGAVLFEAATATLPFPDDDEDDLYPQLRERAPRLRALRPRMARAVAGAIDACLEPEPARRPSIDDLLDVLEAHAGR